MWRCSNGYQNAFLRSTTLFLVCFAMNMPWRTVPLSSTLGQEVRGPVAADAYTSLLNQVQSKRTVILKDAQSLFAANQNLQKRIASEEITANLKTSLSKSIPEFSLSSSTISDYPASKRSSGSSSASRRDPNDATVRSVVNITDNQSYKNSITHEAYYWKLQSTMDQQKLASVNQGLANLLNQLVWLTCKAIDPRRSRNVLLK